MLSIPSTPPPMHSRNPNQTRKYILLVQFLSARVLASLVFRYPVFRRYSGIPPLFRSVPAISIRGHKGQNSTRCRRFLALESQCLGFLVLESRCCDFLSSEKTPWNHDVVAYLSPFLGVMAFSSWNLDVVVFRTWNLDAVVFWSWNLDVVVFWSWNLAVVVFSSWNLDVVVYVPPRPRFRYHRENKKIAHNYVNYVVEKYFSCPNLCSIYLHDV